MIFAYDQLVYKPANDRVKLTNLNTISGSFPGSISVTRDTSDSHRSDFIVLSPMNYTVIPTGISESTSCGDDYKSGMNIFNSSEINAPTDIEANEFTDNINQVETNPNEIAPNPDDDTLDIVGGHTPNSGADFGAGWYSGDH